MGIFDKLGKLVTDQAVIDQVMGKTARSPESLKSNTFYHFYGDITESKYPTDDTIYYKSIACALTIENSTFVRANIDTYNISSLLSGFSFFEMKNAKEHFSVSDENKRIKIGEFLMNKPIEVYNEISPNKVRWRYAEKNDFINAIDSLKDENCSQDFLDYKRSERYKSLVSGAR